MHHNPPDQAVNGQDQDGPPDRSSSRASREYRPESPVSRFSSLSTGLPESTLTVSQVGNKANSAICCEESMNLLAGDRRDTANKEEAKSSATGSIPLPVPPTSCSRPNIIREWRWELITWLLGTFTVWTLFGILLIFKDKSLDTWKSKVQITAVVALFSQLAQSALIVSVSACIGQSKWTLICQKQYG